jgi:peptidyl-prolyl cis-trans isomerase A (cyclophilin A)
MAAETVSRKRSNPSQPKKNPLSSRGVQVGIILVVVIVAAVSAWAVYPKNASNTPTTNPVAVFDTSLGTFRVELFRDKMPQTVNNFVRLVNAGFYNGIIFHRIGANFMIQAGRYLDNGSQKTSPYGNIPFETSDVKHVDGAISMASTGAKVGGAAEFFICDGAQSFLDGNYAAFGVTISGLDVVHTIAQQENDHSESSTIGTPLQNIVINSITIE